ncbi:unnamed protein product, partial [Closterium sp. NIES-54]
AQQPNRRAAQQPSRRAAQQPSSRASEPPLIVAFVIRLPSRAESLCRRAARAAQSVARYSSPATAALSRLFLPYLLPDLTAFLTVADLIMHIRTSDTRYRAALPT